jgi:hypothetical protein
MAIPIVDSRSHPVVLWRSGRDDENGMSLFVRSAGVYLFGQGRFDELRLVHLWVHR